MDLKLLHDSNSRGKKACTRATEVAQWHLVVLDKTSCMECIVESMVSSSNSMYRHFRTDI